jgi:hypothetical protein
MFEKTTDVDNVKDFVTESTNLIKHYSKQQIKENNEKVIRLIKKNKLDEFVEIPEETENLYEAIEYVILNKKSLDNVNNFIKAQNIITEHIENNKKLINEDKEPISFEDFQKELNKEEENLIENINNDEKKLLDMFTNPNANRKQVFENYKSNTLKKIKGAIQIAEENDKQQWEKIYEQINAKTYSDVLSDNIINCAEMSEICSTIEQ